MGNSAPALPIPDSPPIPANKTRICIAAVPVSPYSGRAHNLVAKIAELYPNEYETWYHFDAFPHFSDFIVKKFEPVPFPEHLKGHGSSPFVWLENGEDKVITPIGGCNELQIWSKEKFPNNEQIQALACGGVMSFLSEMWHANGPPATCYNTTTSSNASK